SSAAVKWPRGPRVKPASLNRRHNIIVPDSLSLSESARLKHRDKPKFVGHRHMNLKKLLSRFLLIDLLKGLRVTFKQQAPSEIITEQYPKVRPVVGERFRGAPRLNLDPDTGETLCIA